MSAVLRKLSPNSFQSAGDFFYVPSPLGGRLIILLRYLDELKAAPVDHVDIVGTFIEMSNILLFGRLRTYDINYLRCFRVDTQR